MLWDKLDMDSSGKWLGALISAVFMNFHMSVKIPANPADRFDRF